MKNADLALYRTKADGPQRLLVLQAGDERSDPGPPRPGESTCAERSSEEELELFYQPIVCLESQQMTGFEALCGGLIPSAA